MRRYLVWSVTFHASAFLLGAIIAPLRGLPGSSRPDVVVSVGLVDFADPGRVKGGSSRPKTPAPAEDELIAQDPAHKDQLAEIKAPEKSKTEEKKPKSADTKKPDTTKTAHRPAKKDTAKTSPELAIADGAGVSGTLSEGDGGGDIWGVETGADVNPYHRAGFASIRNNWRNPSVGPVPRLCVIKFRVLRNGQLTDIEIEKTSGSDLFDRAALRAVQVTETWPAFPSHWEENEQLIHLEFEYRP